MRGRKPDAPGLQEAMGNPGRRRSAAVKRREEAERVGELLARSLAQTKGLEPPAIIADDPMSLAMWRDLAPRLVETHRLQPQHRPMFLAFCRYYAEWVFAGEAVGREGHTRNVKTVSGSTMQRLNPMVKIRDEALRNALELSKRFGLTPSDEYSLFRDQAVAAAQNPGLFDRGDQPRAQAELQPETREDGIVGALALMDSAPPARLN